MVFVPAFYVVVRHFTPNVFFVLVTPAALLALWEFYRLHFRDQPARLDSSLGLASALVLLVVMQWPDTVAILPILTMTLMVLLVSRLWSPRNIKHGLGDAAILVLGTLYVAWTLGHLLLIRKLPDGPYLIFFLFLVTWAGDTGAYYAGLGLGSHRLAPVISPNKTVEGLIGGLALAVVTAVLAHLWFLQGLSLGQSLVAGLLLGIAGVLGDLLESAFKRSAGVKDSGVLIPAHGGMLDRLDSLLLTAPAFYYYLYYLALVKPGAPMMPIH